MLLCHSYYHTGNALPITGGTSIVEDELVSTEEARSLFQHRDILKARLVDVGKLCGKFFVL
jgi:hypothetical protein